MKSLTIKARAKINLGLQVLNKRTDNFHEINTIFYSIGLSDEIEMEINDNISLITTPPLGIDEKDNLVFKAANLLKERYKIKSGVQINLKKNIPAAAGLGGGSSDAAATLTALAELWAIDTKRDDMLRIAAAIGSDVPFFLRNGTAAARGRGEILEYFDFKLTYWLLVVNPGIPVSTEQAYKALGRGSASQTPVDFRSALTSAAQNRKSIRDILTNDFEEPAFRRHPQLPAIKNAMYDCRAELALMSGSGSSIFGLFNNEADARSARRKFPDYFTFLDSPDSD